MKANLNNNKNHKYLQLQLSKKKNRNITFVSNDNFQNVTHNYANEISNDFTEKIIIRHLILFCDILFE